MTRGNPSQENWLIKSVLIYFEYFDYEKISTDRPTNRQTLAPKKRLANTFFLQKFWFFNHSLGWFISHYSERSFWTVFKDYFYPILNVSQEYIKSASRLLQGNFKTQDLHQDPDCTLRFQLYVLSLAFISSNLLIQAEYQLCTN